MMYDTINILSIDPGSNLGVSIYTVTVPELQIVNIITYNINLNSITVTDHDTLLYKLRYLKDTIASLCYMYQPRILAIEAAFVNARFPKSGMYLAQYISVIKMTTVELNSYIRIFEYAPKYVKSYIGAKGTADKNDMCRVIKTIPDIVNIINIDMLSEHEIDSLAIGYICIEEIRAIPQYLILL